MDYLNIYVFVINIYLCFVIVCLLIWNVMYSSNIISHSLNIIYLKFYVLLVNIYLCFVKLYYNVLMVMPMWWFHVMMVTMCFYATGEGAAVPNPMTECARLPMDPMTECPRLIVTRGVVVTWQLGVDVVVVIDHDLTHLHHTLCLAQSDRWQATLQ